MGNDIYYIRQCFCSGRIHLINRTRLDQWVFYFFIPAILYLRQLSVYIANVCSSTEIPSSFLINHSLDLKMWNAFDFSFIVVFIGYLTLRIKGLGNDDRMTSLSAYRGLY